jgi:hypothetical protein
MQREQKITLGEMRESGPTRLIVHGADYKCGHSIVIDASLWGDDFRLSDLKPKFARLRFAAIGADIRPCSSTRAWELVSPEKPREAIPPGTNLSMTT